MSHFINNIDFDEFTCQCYYMPPASWSDEKKRSNAMNKIFSDKWLGARKRDGALYVFIKDSNGNIILRGRNKSVKGVYLDKWDLVPHLHEWAESIPNGTCFLGELFSTEFERAKTTTSIMNCKVDKAIERQREEKDKLHYYIFDIMAYDNEIYYKKAAKERFNKVEQLGNSNNNHYVEYAKYYHGQLLWDMLGTIFDEDGEGIVITEESAVYEQGKRPSKTTLKIKKELKQTVDLVIIGALKATREYTGKCIDDWEFWYNTKTNEKKQGKYYNDYLNGDSIIPVTKNFYYDWAGSLILGACDDNGNYIQVGSISGIEQNILANWKDVLGKVAEIQAMEITEDGHLRHPKFIRWRDDKVSTECSIKQLKI